MEEKQDKNIFSWYFGTSVSCCGQNLEVKKFVTKTIEVVLENSNRKQDVIF